MSRPPLRLERLCEPGFQKFTQLGRRFELWDRIDLFEYGGKRLNRLEQPIRACADDRAELESAMSA
jgi:hypothetical protein